MANYRKAMKHHNNPRKWRRTRTKDSRGMSAAGRRGNALIFQQPATVPISSSATTTKTHA